MLQKLIMVILSVFTMIASSISPASLLGGDDPTKDPFDRVVPGSTVNEEFYTKGYAAGHRQAAVSVLSVIVDGREVFDDSWGQGKLGELTFKVGVKRAEGNSLVIGGNEITLNPLDTLTIRNFRGQFAFKDVGTPSATIALDGTVETTTVAQGELVTKVRTQVLPADPTAPLAAPKPATVDVAYVTLDTGEAVNTVTWETGASARLYTWSPGAPDPDGEAASVLAKWIKVNGKEVKQYSWGDGITSRIEFEPTERSSLGALLNWSGTEYALQPRKAIAIENFVGTWAAFEAVGGGMKLRLDGYAGDFTITDGSLPIGGPGNNLEPIARMGYGPEFPTTSDYVQFQDLSEDPDGLVVFREWTFGDSNTTSVLAAPKHKFTEPGRWPVTLRVTDNGLSSAEVVQYVEVANTPPVADWDFNPKNVFALDNVRFEDKSWDPDDSNGPVSRVWDVGDGTPPISDASFLHQYARPGTYTATLTVTDSAGDSDSLSKVIVVNNRLPIPSFDFTPSTPLSLQDIQFTDASTDRDGYIVEWAWDFGDGTTSITPNPVKNFTNPGSYLVALTVKDDQGDSATSGITLGIQNRAPDVAFSYSPPIGINTSTIVQFTDLSVDTDGDIVEWRWNFGDNTPVDTRQNPTHRFFRTGTFEVTLTVKDDLGTQASTSRSLFVENSGPDVKFTWTPNTEGAPVTDQSVAFQDLSTDPDGDTLVAWDWSFGDGTTSTERHPVHRYAAKGQYLVRLEVKDDEGKVGAVTKTLTVYNALPTVSFAFTPENPTTRTDVAFSGVATDSDGSIVSRSWSFGDNTLPGSGANVTHRFTTAGTYRVTFTAIDNDGGERSASRDVVVLKAEPVANFTWSPRADPAPQPGQDIQFTDTTDPADAVLQSWSWDFGDGSTSTAQHPTHAFAESGTFPVRLRVTTAAGQEYEKRHDVRVNVPPTAAFTSNVSSPSIGHPVRFTDASTDPDGAIQSWSWDFGDGSGAVTGQGPHDHAFLAPGSFTVTLTVADADGATASATRTISVANAGPTADFSWSPNRPARHATAQFTDLSRDPNEPYDAVESWQWIFGVGASSTAQDPAYAFPSSGIHSVKLTASDGQATSSVTKSLRVTSDHDLTTRICSRLPDGRFLDHSLGMVGFFANHTKPTGWGGATTITKVDPRVSVEAGGCVLLTLPHVEWAEGDAVTFKVKIFGASSEATGTLSPTDEMFVVNRTLHLPLPLVPDAEVRHGQWEPFLSPPIDLRAPGADYNYPTYVNQFEPVTVQGQVAWFDGPAAVGVKVDIVVRYIGVRALTYVPEVLNNPVTGYCVSSTATTNAVGGFEATIGFTPHCLRLFTEDGAFLPGWYQVYAVASCSECGPADAQKGRSETMLFYEDPLGLVYGRVGTPDPL